MIYWLCVYINYKHKKDREALHLMTQKNDCKWEILTSTQFGMSSCFRSLSRLRNPWGMKFRCTLSMTTSSKRKVRFCRMARARFPKGNLPISSELSCRELIDLIIAKFRLRKVMTGHGGIPTGSKSSTYSVKRLQWKIRPHCGEDSGSLLLRQTFGYNAKIPGSELKGMGRRCNLLSIGIEVICVVL